MNILGSEYKKISGIYAIKSLIDYRIYIGSSVNLYNRSRDHLYAIRNGHYNTKIKNFVNKYSEDSLEFIIIEVTDINKLLSREQYWIDYYDSVNKGFNICKIAGNTMGHFHSEETKKKIGLKSIGRKQSEKNKLETSLRNKIYCGEKSSRAILNNSEVILIKKLLYYEFSCTFLSKIFNVNFRTIHNIKSNRRWKCIPEYIPNVTDRISKENNKLLGFQLIEKYLESCPNGEWLMDNERNK